MGVEPGHPGGIAVGVGRQSLRQWVPGTHGHHKAIAGLLEHPRPGQHFEHAAEEALVLVDDLQAAPQGLGIHGRTRLALPTQLVQGGQRVGLRQPLQILQQGRPALGSDPFGCKVLCEQAQACPNGRRTREEVRRRHSRRQGRVPPHHLVEEILQSFDRGQQGGPSRPLDRVAAQFANQDPTGIVDAQIPAQDL